MIHMKRFLTLAVFLVAIGSAAPSVQAADQGFRYQWLGINGPYYLGESLCDVGLRYAPGVNSSTFDRACFWRTPDLYGRSDLAEAFQRRAGVCRRPGDSADGFNPGLAMECGDISGLNLAGANLQNQALIGMKAYNVNLSGANAAGANLHEFQGYRANLTNANFLYANFWNARLDGVQASGALFNGTHFVVKSGLFSGLYDDTGYIFGVAQGGNFENAHFNEAYVKLECSGCNLRNADFYSLQIDHGNPSTLYVRGSDLRGASFMRANVMISAILSDLRGVVSAQNAVIAGEGSPYFAGSNLSNANFSQASMQATIFENMIQHRTVAQNANFSSSDLRFAFFRAADFRSANFQNADLRWSWYIDNNMQGANFTGANLESAVFGIGNSCTDFRNSSLAQAASLQGATIPRACLAYLPITEAQAVSRGMQIR